MITAEEHESYDYVIGIDFGSVTSGASIAHKEEPFNIFTISEWDKILEDNEEASSDLEAISRQFPTTIFYKKHEEGEDYEISCGLRSFDDEIVLKKEGDIYIDCIKQLMLVDRDESSRLLQQYNRFTVEKVFTDFIKSFYQKVMQAFKNHTTFSKSFFFEKKFLKSSKLNNIRYCIASPKSLHDIIRQGFVDAGIVNENQKEKRISFVAESVATAYCCIAQDREKTEITSGKEYLVCDFGYSSFGISKIITCNTESESKVKLISEDQEIGSKMFVAKLKEYFMKNNQRISDSSLKPYSTGEKYFGFENDTSVLRFDNQKIEIPKKDLYNYVFKPTIERVEKGISKAYEEATIEKIFLSGKYACETDFRNQLKSNEQFDGVIDVDSDLQSVDSVSIGAVSFELRKQQPSQIPFLKAKEKVIEKGVSKEKVTKDEVSKAEVTEKREYKFVVGIDFGTTFSGCSYAPYNKSSDTRITTIVEWGGNDKFGKTPTCLLYKKINAPEEGVDSWGQEAKQKMENLTKRKYLEKSPLLLQDFKLFLSLEESKKLYRHELLQPKRSLFDEKFDNSRYKRPDMSTCGTQYTIDAIRVISDYLRNFNCKVLEKLRRDDKNISSKDIKYVLTVPAFWGIGAKDALIEAAQRAEIIEEKSINDLLVITEPEAAALYCETSTNLCNFFDGDKRFILCDAGGGTVDLVAFEYSKVSKTGQPAITQVGDPEGAMCGSTYLDARFASYINSCFEDIGYTYGKYPPIESAMKEFKALKNDFNKEPKSETIRFTLPEITHIQGYQSRNHEENGIHTIEDGDTLVITRKELAKHIFEPVFDQVAAAIQRKIDKMKNDKVIDGIIMVGGFSENDYLRSYIKKKFGTKTTKVLHPDDALGIQAISRGAVSYGLYPRLISEEVLDRSFAMEVLKQPGDNSLPNRYLEYFIQENTKVDSSLRGSISKTVYVEQDKSAIIAIHTRDSKDVGGADDTQNNCKVLTDNHKKTVEMRIDSSLFQGRVREGSLVPITVILNYNRNSYTIKVRCGSSTVGRSEKADEKLFEIVYKSSDFTKNISRKYPKEYYTPRANRYFKSLQLLKSSIKKYFY